MDQIKKRGQAKEEEYFQKLERDRLASLKTSRRQDQELFAREVEGITIQVGKEGSGLWIDATAQKSIKAKVQQLSHDKEALTAFVKQIFE